MKYVISENRVHSLINNFLETKNFWFWDVGDGEFSLSDGREGDVVLSFRYTFNYEFQEYEPILHVEPKFIRKIHLILGFEPTLIISSLIKWFNEKYDKQLTINDFEWMDH